MSPAKASGRFCCDLSRLLRNESERVKAQPVRKMPTWLLDTVFVICRLITSKLTSPRSDVQSHALLGTSGRNDLYLISSVPLCHHSAFLKQSACFQFFRHCILIDTLLVPRTGQCVCYSQHCRFVDTLTLGHLHCLVPCFILAVPKMDYLITILFVVRPPKRNPLNTLVLCLPLSPATARANPTSGSALLTF